MNLVQRARGAATVTMSSGAFSWTIPRDHFVSIAWEFGGQRYGNCIRGLNAAGFVLNMFALPIQGPWPFDLPVHERLTILLPVLCIPVWWLVGLGIESLL